MTDTIVLLLVFVVWGLSVGAAVIVALVVLSALDYYMSLQGFVVAKEDKQEDKRGNARH